MIKLKPIDKYSKSEIEDIANEVSYVSNHAFSKAEMLATLFTKSKRINYDPCFEGLAAINIDHGAKVIVNRQHVLERAFASLPFVITNIDMYPFLVTVYRGQRYLDVETYISHFASYLILHEVGHYLYTVPASVVRKNSAAIAKAKHIPFSFVFFVCNVVEDSFIQRRLQLDYPIEYYREVFFLGTTVIQGPFAVLSYKAELDKATKLSIRDKLFYLVLRAYNLFDADVQSMFNMNPLIEWTPEVLALFDRVTGIIDSNVRNEVTVNELVPALFDILHEVVKVQQDELNNCVPDSSSLLDEDKLREAELDENQTPPPSSNQSSDQDDSFSSTDATSGNPDSDQPEDEDGEETDCPSNDDDIDSDDSESDGDDEEECDDSGESDEEHDEDYERSWGPEDDEDEEEEDDSSDSDDSEEDDLDELDDLDDEVDDEVDDSDDEVDEEVDDEEEDDDEASTGGDDSDSTDDDSSSQSSDNDKPQEKGSDHKSLEDAAKEIEDNFNKELEDASKELNSSIDENTEREFTEEDLERLQDNAENIDSNDVVNAINDITKAVQKDAKSMAKLDSYNSVMSTFNDEAQQLFNTASQLFKRIYTFDTEDLSYLDNGELDENLITDFYTEKSINIFKQHLDLVEAKKIKIVFLVDDSGSMYDMRAANCRTIVPPLIHAFEESGIQCAFYMFGSNCALIKDFDDPAVLINNSMSNVLYQRDHVDCGGSTNITPALLSLAGRNYDDFEDTVYILFVFTDGCFDNEETASDVFYYLRKQLHFNLFGVTIDDRYDGPARLKRCMYQNSPDGDGCVMDYSTSELITKLPEDIYTTIVDRFIKKN